MNIFKKTVEDLEEGLDEDNIENDNVSIGTKIKIISALLVVGVATYVAYWVQEPTDMRADVLSSIHEENEEEPTEDETAEDVIMGEVALAKATSSKNFEIEIEDFSFMPASVTVNQGTTVIWTNMDQVAHTISGEEFSSGSLKAGETFIYTFDEPGEYEYYCAFHPQMTGTITVAAAESIGLETEEFTEEYFSEDLFGAADENAPLFENDALLEETNESSLLGDQSEAVTLSAPQLSQTNVASITPDQLATTGPEEVLYVLVIAAILFINRRKLFAR
jgi:plastocyanin